MTLAFATGRGPGPLESDALLAEARALDVRAIFLSAPVARPARWRSAWKAAGVQACGVAPRGDAGASDEDGARFATALAEAAACAAALRAPALVVEGGGLGSRLEDRLREAEDDLRAGAEAATAAWRAERAEAREEATERALRALYADLRAGVPLSVRPGAGPADLLGFEETGWLLGELRGLGLWLDPARATRAQRLGWGPALDAWLDAYARRCTGVFVQGLGRDLDAGLHPAEGGLDWGHLARALPRRVPWVIDLAPSRSADALADAVALLRAALG